MKRKLEKTALLIFPNSLFPQIDLDYDKVFVIEEPEFFKPNDYNINKIKLAYFRATLKYHFDNIHHQEKEYIEFSNVKNYEFLQNYQVTYFDTLDRKLELKLEKYIVDAEKIESRLFLLTEAECLAYFQKPQKRYIQQNFFEFVKGKLGVLKNVASHDHENRNALPKNHGFKWKLPSFDTQDVKKYYIEARNYVDSHPEFKDNLGSTENVHRYPISHEAAKTHFIDFLESKVKNFGPFEDAIDKKESILFHSFSSAPLNIGLVSPKWILDKIMERKDSIPMNSLEGFVRQLLGWREYQRGIYVAFPKLSEANHFEHKNRLNWDYWTGKTPTGLPILDNEIKKAMNLGYSHHIPRLCIFLNMFNLLGVEMEEIVKWFSQVICMDAYPWVMYSNIASMGYFDTRFMQKPYITASAYLLKMSNYEKGPWCEIWNSLFYNFLSVNKPRLTGGASVYLRNLAYFEKKTSKEQQEISKIAEKFIKKVTKS